MLLFLIILFLFFLFLISSAILRRIKPISKGKYFEQCVSNKISQLPDEYIVLNNLFFENNGHSTQIDHIIASPYGVFVIESKGYKGWITGGENSEYWTQTIFNSKYQFYNPIRQNAGHVRFLRHLLGTVMFIPIIVFDNSANIKAHVESIVVNICNLNYSILQYKTPVLSKEAVDTIVQIIRSNSKIANEETLKQHINNVRTRQYQTDNLIEQGICPQCGGNLVLRQGKYGSFYGCSNYPRCKFTINK